MSDKSELKFTSFSWKRLICAMIYAAIGFITLIIFYPLSGRYVPTGSVMTFEGPSYFVPTGLIPLLVGIGLIVYSILSYFKGNISKDDKQITISEKRYFKLIETKIEKEKILKMNLTNNEIGIKYIWLFLFIPYLIINYYYMILNFNQPFIIGFVNITGIVILISIIISAFGLIILFAFPQWLMEIYTNEGKYELWFEPYKHGREVINNIARTLEIIKGNTNEKIEIDPFKNFSLKNVLLSSFFLAYGIFNVVSFMTTLAIFQTIICHILIIMGVYLLSKELRNLPIPSENSDEDQIKYKIQSKYYQKYYCVRKIDEKKIKYMHDDFDVFWAVCAGIIFIFTPFNIIQNWMVINYGNIGSVLDDAIITTIFGSIILFLVAFYILIPEKYLWVKSDKWQFKYPLIKIVSKNKLELKRISHELKIEFKSNFEDPLLKSEFKKRILFVLISGLIGFIVLLWQYFFYFNLFNIFNL